MACWAEYGNSDLNQTTNRQNNQRNSNILFQGRTGYLEDRKGIPSQETLQTLFSKFLRILVTKASTKRILKNMSIHVAALFFRRAKGIKNLTDKITDVDIFTI